MNHVREFYQSLATAEERSIYMAAIKMTPRDREEYLRHAFGVKATEEMLREFAQASRGQLIDIANGVVREAAKETRKGILKGIAYFLSFKWLKG